MNPLRIKMILEAVDRITAPVRRISNRISAALKRASESVGNFASKMDLAGKKAAEIGGFLTTRLTLPIVGLGALSIRSAGQVEELAYQFEHLAGGANQAQRFVQSLQGYINRFGAEDVGQAAKQLEIAGYNIDQINNRLGVFSNVAAGSKQALASVVDQYIALRKAGKVSDGDLTALMKANIPIVQELAKQLGVTDRQVFNMAASGRITFNQYKKALEGLTEEGGRFAGAMERRGRMINGVFTEMKNSLNSMLAEFGSSLWDDLKIADKVKQITDAVRSLIKGFLALSPEAKSTITWVVLLAAAFGPLVLIFGQFIVGVAGVLLVMSKMPLLFSGASTAALGLVKVFKLLFLGVTRIVGIIPALIAGVRALGLALITNPIGLFIAAISALAVASFFLIKHWDKVKAFFKGLWGTVKTAFKEGVEGALSFLKPLIDAIAYVIDTPARIGRNIGNGVRGALDYLTGDDTGGATASSQRVATARNARERVDAGGTIKIEINQTGQAQLVAARSNDTRIRYRTSDTGALLGAR